MPTLKAYHQYKAINPKSSFEVLPIADREVPQRIFDQLRDVTKDNGALVALRKVEDITAAGDVFRKEIL